MANLAGKILTTYSEDLLFLLFLAFMLPWLQARLVLWSIFPVFTYWFGLLMAVLMLGEIIAIPLFYKHQQAIHGQTNSRPLLVFLSFFRLFFFLPYAAFSDGFPGNITIVAGIIWFCGNFYFLLMFSGGEFAVERHKLPLAGYVIAKIWLWTNMCFMVAIGYTYMHRYGGIFERAVYTNAKQLFIYLFLVVVLYFPPRLYEFLAVPWQDFRGRKFWLNALWQLILFAWIISEIGTSNPPILDTALSVPGATEKLTTLDLTHSDLENLAELEQFRNLKELNLDFNNLTDFPEVVFKLRSLSALSLRANGFSVLPARLAELPDLRKLYVADNKLENIPAEFTEKFDILDARGNPLKNLEPKVDSMFLQKRGWKHD